MKPSLLKLILLVFFIFIILLTHATITLAADTDIDGIFYLKLNAFTISTEGDFDGHLSGSPLNYNNVNYYLPKLLDGTGLGFHIGEIRGRAAGEIYYSSAQQTGTDNLYNYPCTKNEYGYNFKYLLINPKSAFNIYLLIGLGFPQIAIGDGARNTITAELGKATFYGSSYNYGLGTTIKLSRHLQIEGSYTISQLTINQLESFGKKTDLINKLLTTEKTSNLSFNYLF